MTRSPSTPGGPRTALDELDPDARARLGSDDRRRSVLEALEARRPPVTLSRLAADVARREGAEIVPVAVSLLHHHLPAMTELGLLAFDAETMRVESYGTGLGTPGSETDSSGSETGSFGREIGSAGGVAFPAGTERELVRDAADGDDREAPRSA